MGFISSFFNEQHYTAAVADPEGQRECGSHKGALAVGFFSTFLSHNLGVISCENTSNWATVPEVVTRRRSEFKFGWALPTTIMW